MGNQCSTHILATKYIDKVRILQQKFLETRVGKISMRLDFLMLVNHLDKNLWIISQEPWIFSVIQTILTKHFSKTRHRHRLILLVYLVKRMANRLLFARNNRVSLEQVFINPRILLQKLIVLLYRHCLLPIQIVIQLRCQVLLLLSCRILPITLDIE